jgi:hypothetical protein
MNDLVDDRTDPYTSASEISNSVKCVALASMRGSRDTKLDKFSSAVVIPETDLNTPLLLELPSAGGCTACEIGRHVVSTSRVSIIRTEPSDEYASTLMGTRLVIIAVDDIVSGSCIL